MVFCSFSLSSKLALCVSKSDFLKVFKPLKPEKIFCSIDIFLLSESRFVSAKLDPL